MKLKMDEEIKPMVAHFEAIADELSRQIFRGSAIRAEFERNFTGVTWYENNGHLANAYKNPDYELLKRGWPQVCRHTFRWINGNGHVEYDFSGPFRTSYGAKFSALRRAVKSGYTRPKWWQYWRWNESKI